MGCAGVGKTSLCERLGGKAFERKPHKVVVSDEAVKHTFEVHTSGGMFLFNLYDWTWEEARKDHDINKPLARGKDGAIFCYDVTRRQSLSDFQDHHEWYQRASGFDKPWLILSLKNDQKKKAVEDVQGKSLTKKGPNRMFAVIDLVDDVGVDEVALNLAKMFTNDSNLSLVSFGAASPAALKWSEERAIALTENLGMGGMVEKTSRVMLMVLNSAVAKKFNEMMDASQFEVEQWGSVQQCEDEINATAAGESESDFPTLPIHGILVPPSSSESQQQQLKALADKHGLKFGISIPKNALEAIV